jgi:CRISPR-associated protein Cas2
MLIVSYDFEGNRVRARFSKFLEKYGWRIQYSVFQLKDSDRVLQNILAEIDLHYKQQFTGADSIVIFHICEGCKKRVRRYGYAKHEESDVVMIG